jgi:hypothetical protein
LRFHVSYKVYTSKMYLNLSTEPSRWELCNDVWDEYGCSSYCWACCTDQAKIPQFQSFSNCLCAFLNCFFIWQ